VARVIVTFDAIRAAPGRKLSIDAPAAGRGLFRVIKDPRHNWEIAAMKTLTQMLRSLNLGSGAHRRRVGERHAGAASLGGAEGASHA
jgi:hypothetical protein